MKTKTITKTKELSILALNLRAIRKDYELTQADFGEMFGISRSLIGSYEEGRANPPYDTLIAISNFSGFSVDTMLKQEIVLAKEEDVALFRKVKEILRGKI